MAKNQQQAAPTPVRSGMRRHNASNGRGTIHQDVARRDPKWKNVGNFSNVVLERITEDGTKRNHIYMKDGKWVSMPKDDFEFQMASILAQQAQAEAMVAAMLHRG